MEKKITKLVLNVGAQKAGTSWLFKCMEEHPDVCAASGKETNFFLSENLDLNEYKKKYQRCPDRNTYYEGSTLYLYDKNVPARIKKSHPDAKIIILLRHPVDRTISHLRHLKNKSLLPQDTDIEKAIEIYPELISHSQYEQWVKEFMKHFSKEKILVLDFARIKKDPQSLITEICYFVGINDFKPKFIHKKYNTSAARSNYLYNKVTHWYLVTKYHRLGEKFIATLRKLHINSSTVEKLLSVTASNANKKVSNEEYELFSSILEDDIEFYERQFQIN